MTSPDPNGYNGNATGIIAGAGLSALAGRTRENVEAQARSQVSGMPTIDNIFSMLWNGLDTTLGLPFALIVGLVERMFPWIDLPTINSLSDLFGAIGEVPLISNVVDAITGGVNGTIHTLVQFFENVRAFLGSINFLANGFNLADAAVAFINLILWPVDMLAKLIGGVVPGVSVPLLDQSKVVGLTSALTTINTTLTNHATRISALEAA